MPSSDPFETTIATFSIVAGSALSGWVSSSNSVIVDSS